MIDNGQFNVWESVSEFARACAREPRSAFSDHAGWTGESLGESFDRALHGWPAGATVAAGLVERFIDAVELPTIGRDWVDSVEGAYPIVPNAILGVPESMRRRVSNPAAMNPIRVFACTASHSKLPHALLERRGAAILAAALALGQTRPVELFTFSASHATRNNVIRIGMSPLVLSDAAVALCSIGFHRTLQLGYLRARHGYTGRFAGWQESISSIREALGDLVSPDDLIVPPALNDDSELVRDPIEWVRQVLESGRLAAER